MRGPLFNAFVGGFCAAAALASALDSDAVMALALAALAWVNVAVSVHRFRRLGSR